ncbi:MAG: biotin--[acetyl-CoA-carboxylase] ligase [Draconibacterium sp.]|nr:biotin--[acetyl-CoA-carboxylase] ligase [Draconibacterium sp.]
MMTGKNTIFLTEVESTNNYANQLVLSKAAEHGTVVLAQYQKKGKGQQGNSWESEPGKNLLASIILFPDFLSAAKQFYLSKIASLSIVDFLKTETSGITIKWPNDIYIDNKKVAGILIENAIKGHNLSSSIIGIGLNLNQELFVTDAPNPVSLKQVSTKDYEIENIAETIFDNMIHWYQILKKGVLMKLIQLISINFTGQMNGPCLRNREYNLKQELTELANLAS